MTRVGYVPVACLLLTACATIPESSRCRADRRTRAREHGLRGSPDGAGGATSRARFAPLKEPSTSSIASIVCSASGSLGATCFASMQRRDTRLCTVSPETLEVLRTAQAGQRLDWRQVRRDVRRAVGPVEVRSRSGQSDSASGGRARAVAARRLHSGGVERRPWHRVSVSGLACRVHLGGIGKGYAVDRAAAILRAEGISDFLIQSGGDLYASGSRGDRPWRAGIRDPRGPVDRIFAAMNLHDETFSTSGDYERYLHSRRAALITTSSTRTKGAPARGCRSVTIVARQAVLADALSTGVFVLGPQAGMALIERLPDVEGVIVTERQRGAGVERTYGAAGAAALTDRRAMMSAFRMMIRWCGHFFVSS